MITIFTIPKPFVGHSAMIQRNAIKSWLELYPKCEIILYGDDYGIAEIANELSIKHIQFIEKNEFNTPLLSSAFSFTQKIAANDILIFANSDIIFFQDLITSVEQINMPSYLICGRRWDLNMNFEIDFDSNVWVDKLKQMVAAEGKLHGLSGMDYFIFRRNSVAMPPFAVGRPGWDTWFIYDMRHRKIPIIDASEAITVIHQNHDFSHSQYGKKNRVGGPEWIENIKVAGGFTNMLTLRDANWILNKNGLKKLPLPRRVYSLLSQWYLWRLLLAMKRNLQEFMRR